MRIAFNAQRLAGQRLGVGRYIEYMLRYWRGMLTPDETVTVFLRRALSAETVAYLGLPPSMPTRVLPPDISGIPWENISLRWPASKHDVLFCPAYNAPVGYRGRLVVATHSVNHIQPGAHPSFWYKHTYARLNRHCAEIADAVIVASQSAKDDIARVWRIPEEKMIVVLQGADDCFRPVNDAAALSAVRRKYFGGDRPYILFVGTASVRRNALMLIRAFAKARREHNLPHGLLFFGPNSNNLPIAETCAELGIASDVVQTDGKIDNHADLVPIYNAADVFIHPSEYEGWSMTTVEAMACGTAVIASNRGGLGEAARGHALMLEIPSIDSISEALAHVLGDEGFRHELKRKEFARGSALRWHETTRQTLDVVRSVARR
jgi:glycosyltransferase involved in cell wall biosynthesis